MQEYGKQAAVLRRMLSDIGAQDKSDRELSVLSLRIRLRKGHSFLYRRYKELTCLTRIPAGDKWLFDNFFTASLAYKEAYKNLRGFKLPAKNKGLPDLFLLIYKMLEYDSVCPFKCEGLQKGSRWFCEVIQSVRALTCSEYAAYLSLLKAAVVLRIAELVHMNSETDGEQLSMLFGLLAEAGGFSEEQLISETSLLHKAFMQEHGGVYPKMDRPSQAYYRYCISQISRYSGEKEISVAKRIIGQSGKQEKPLGELLEQKYKSYIPKSPFADCYRWLCFFFPIAVSLIISGLIGNPLFSLLIFFPLYELLRPIAQRLSLIGVRVSPPLRIRTAELDEKSCKTLIVISRLLTENFDGEALYLSCRDMLIQNSQKYIGLCLLCDLPASKTSEAAPDKKAIHQLKTVVDRLNRDWGERTLMLVRPRKYSKTQDCYTGYERKRGAINDLTAILSGTPIEYAALHGATRFLSDVSYILALDADTKLKINSVTELLTVAEHPMNKRYGIFAPRVATSLHSAVKTRFSGIMCGGGGTITYSQEAAELYQDLFDKAIFSGKGLIRVKEYSKELPKLFLEETILSHDILEGGILSVRYVGDVELLDEFPDNDISYLKRLHRWIRGDFQNAVFIMSTVRLYQGLFKNPFSSVVRFQLFDNLRRALQPAFCLLTFLLGWLGGERAAFLYIIGIAGFIAPYIASFIDLLLHGGISILTTRFYTAMPVRSQRLLGEAIISLMFLPSLAFTGIDGAVKGLYRRLVSKKKLLEWATAAQTGLSSMITPSIVKRIKFYSPQLILGLALLFTQNIVLVAAGGFFILSVFLLEWYSNPSEMEYEPAEKGKERLTAQLRDLIGYYKEYAVNEDNFLSPDNVQFSPVFRVAHRTSPTNIGMQLISYLIERDAGLCDTKQLYEQVNRVITTVEKLKTYHGNLYNWYDTQTLETLKPEFVSAVDSGNLLCCLVSLEEGLSDYEKEEKEISKLRQRIKVIIQKARLSVFYDEAYKLFSIGYDPQSGENSKSHYDMLMSEARMTSYLAIALGQVPTEHWNALNRSHSSCGRYKGPISWTGTLFEYFMPALMLPCPPGSIGYEALYYCIACQKKRAKDTKTPFGISESGIYCFDAELNYQYRPNGVQRLARKRGMDNELVVSPYSSFLAMPYDMKFCMENISLLESISGTGEHGLYEALDYTPERVGEHGMLPVRSYMAHHVGMSVAGIGNALLDGTLQKRFMRNPMMAAAEPLLQEKCRVGEETSVFFDFIRKSNIQPDKKTELHDYTGELYPQKPRVRMLHNGSVSAFLCDSGTGFLRCGETDITRRPTDPLRNPKGTFCHVKIPERRFCATLAPEYRNDVSYETTFSDSAVTYYASTPELKVTTQVRLQKFISCEQRAVTLENKSGADMSPILLFTLEPVLFGYRDDSSHPAFSKLFLNVKRDDKHKAVIINRKKRGSEEPFCMALGFREDIDFALETCRERLYERPNSLSPKDSIFTDELLEDNGTPDPTAAMRVSVSLPKKGEVTLHLLTSIGKNEADALSQLRAARNQPPIGMYGSASSGFTADSLAYRVAQTLLPQVLFGSGDSNKRQEAAMLNRLPLSDLWELGISGDVPIVVVDIYSVRDIERISAYLQSFSLLKSSFLVFDLVFLHEEGTDSESLRQIVSEKVNESTISAKGGVHIVNKGSISDEKLMLIYASACHIATRSLVKIETPVLPYEPVEFKQVSHTEHSTDALLNTVGGSFAEKGFFIEKSPILPWCHILSNETFGTLLSDKALGFTWAINSRENKLTPWYNDTMRDNTGEMLILSCDDSFYNMTNGANVEFSPLYASYHGNADGIITTTKVTVPKAGMYKDISVTLKNTLSEGKTVSAAYYCEPIIGSDTNAARLLQLEERSNCVLIRQPNAANSCVGIGVNAAFTLCCDRAAFLSGRWSGVASSSMLPCADPSVAVIVEMFVPSGSEYHLKFRMAYGASDKSVTALLSIKEDNKAVPKEENSLTVVSKKQEIDVMVNTWLPWQTTASRLYGRTGFYQCGGAYGFRDQLQDACNVLLLNPKLAKRQIARCCAMQFEEGDVLHWWHVMPQSRGGKKGVRTRCSDDLLWLPWAVWKYVSQTGDALILNTRIPFLSAPELSEEEKDRYIQLSDKANKGVTENVHEHCKRALKRGIQKGKHGLILMGESDWNDGYSNVGVLGEGESIWLSLFAVIICKGYAEVCSITDSDFSKWLLSTAQELSVAVEKHGYDKAWYLRAYYDNGDKMGTHSADECQIDSLPQSFAAFAEQPDKKRILSGLENAYNQLVNHDTGVIRLFTPAFDKSSQEPGYVKAYPKGVRENGGQYTHAAIWLAMAFSKIGDTDKLIALSDILNPVLRAKDEAMLNKYRLEPYYMAADIYSGESIEGRGGWSMYTGSAGWYYTLLTSCILGIRLIKGELSLQKPVLPADAYPCRAELSCNGKLYELFCSKQGEDWTVTVKDISLS